MIYICNEYDLHGEHFLAMQLYSTCCKDKILFKQLSPTTFFNMETMEECNDNFNKLILNAIENKKFLPKYLE